ncbi:MAG: TIGR03619 family F420-dependent LLM class oxidoreductase [Acidimicrobiia bacterium]
MNGGPAGVGATAPHFGISAYDIPLAEVGVLAARAEELGFDRISLGEHLVAPTERRTPYPYAAGSNAYVTYSPADAASAISDPFVLLSWIAARTTRLRVATGIHLVASTHPLLTARACVTLQTLAGGRFELGVGAGWMAEELEAVGVPFGERASRAAEALEVVEAALRGGPIEHHGRHFAFSGVAVTPRPVAVPIVVGGTSPAALRRAARFGDGWYSTPADDVARCVELRARIEALRAEVGRADRPFAYHVRLHDATPEGAARYVEAGFTDLTIGHADLWPKAEGLDLAAKLDRLEACAEAFGIGAPYPAGSGGRGASVPGPVPVPATGDRDAGWGGGSPAAVGAGARGVDGEERRP